MQLPDMRFPIWNEDDNALPALIDLVRVRHTETLRTEKKERDEDARHPERNLDC
jgi:hypothetical protein